MAIDSADPALGTALLMNLQQGSAFLPIAAVRSMCTGEGFVSEYSKYVEVEQIGGVLHVNLPQFKAIYGGICMNASRPELKNMSEKYSTRKKLYYSDGNGMTVRRRKISAKGKPLRYDPQYTYRTKVKATCGGKVLRKEVFFPVGTQGKKGLEKAKEIKRAIKEGMRPIELKNKYHSGCEVLLKLENELRALEAQDVRGTQKEDNLIQRPESSAASKFPERQSSSEFGKPLAKIGDVVDLYRVIGPSLGIEDDTVKKNVNSLLRMLRQGIQDYQKLEGCSGAPAKLLKSPITILDAKVVHEYRNFRFGSVSDVAERKKMARGINSVQTQARSVFSREAMAVYECADVWVPRPESFMAVAKLKETKKKRRLPDIGILRSVFEGLSELRDRGRVDLYACLLLVLFAGLRQKEFAYLQCFSIRKTNRWRIHLKNLPGLNFRLKDNEERDIPIPEALALHLLEILNGRSSEGIYREGFLLEGNKTYRNNNLSRELNKWLRSRGLVKEKFQKPTHELRGWCASVLAYLYSTKVAQHRLGHEKEKTTEDYYIDNRVTKEIVSLWEDCARELFEGEEAFVDRD